MGKLGKKKIAGLEDWDSEDGKIIRLEHLIANWAGIKALAHKVSTDMSYRVFNKNSENDLRRDYKEWIEVTTGELSKIFATPRNSAKFESHTQEKTNKGWFPSLGVLDAEDIEKEAAGKIDLLEEMLKELKSSVHKKESPFQRIINNKLFLALAPLLFLILIKILVYLSRGYKFNEIPFP